mgnify:CR=1 FL=1
MPIRRNRETIQLTNEVSAGRLTDRDQRIEGEDPGHQREREAFLVIGTMQDLIASALLLDVKTKSIN